MKFNLKVLSPIDFTEEGIDIFLNELQVLKQSSLILFKTDPDSKVTSCKDSHTAKADDSIIWTEEGISICTNEWQQKNEEQSIF